MTGRQRDGRLDGFLAKWAPETALRRAEARVKLARMEALEASYNQRTRATHRGGMDQKSAKYSEGRVLADDLPELMERSRDTFRNNSVYSGLLRRAADMQVGTGPIVVPQTGDTGLNNDLQRAFGEYATAGGPWAVNGMSLAEACRVAAIGAMREGNVLAYRADAGWQFFEGTQIGTPMRYGDRGLGRVFGGVEVDENDRPVRYWVGPYSRFGYLEVEGAFGIRADRCALLGHREYFVGYRAAPALASGLNRFDDLDGYLEAELFGARMASAVVGEMTTPDDEFWRALHGGELPESATDTLQEVTWQPGNLIRTQPGEEFKLHAVNRPGTAFGEFVRLMFRICGVPIGMPLELGLMDFSETNFSSAKMLLIQSTMTAEVWRASVPRPLVARVYRDWLETAWDGRTSRGVRDEDLRRFEIQFPKLPWIDALKEAQARFVGVKGGWLSLEDVAREMNRDLEDVLAERVRQIEMAARLCDAAKHPEWLPLVLSQVGDLDDLQSVLGMGAEGGNDTGTA